MDIFYLKPICPKQRKWGLVLTMFIYIILSSFSTYEVIHLSPIIPNKMLAAATIVVFAVCVFFPIYLAHIHKNISLGIFRIVLELLPIIIIVSLILFSCCFAPDNTTAVILFAVVIAEILSAIILIVYTKLLHSRVKKIRIKRVNQYQQI